MKWTSAGHGAAAYRQIRTFGSTIQKVAFDASRPDSLEQQLLQQASPAPVVVTGAMRNWSARNWSLQHLQQFGNVSVPVEVSYNGGDYRDLHAANSTRRFEADMQVPLSVLLDCMQASSSKQDHSDIQLYAAQVDLLSMIPELEEGIGAIPLQVIRERLYKRNTWLGEHDSCLTPAQQVHESEKQCPSADVA